MVPHYHGMEEKSIGQEKISRNMMITSSVVMRLISSR